MEDLRYSLELNKHNIPARNLLGLVYYEVGEVVSALTEWIISKNLEPEKNIADEYINAIQANPARLETINQMCIRDRHKENITGQGGRQMIDFEEELKKFHPSLEVEQVEDNVYKNKPKDMSDPVSYTHLLGHPYGILRL